MDERNGNKKNVSKHILPTSSNLLGLCFVILSFLKISEAGSRTFLDELVAIAMIFFLGSSLFSYASIRAHKKPERLERIADIIFLVGLTFLLIISLTITFRIVE